ncbi:hypothetical protein ACWCQQ_14035 [Streptomyces sp. NPDC002143]
MQLVFEQFGARVVADGDEQAGRVQVAGGTGEDVSQDDAVEHAVALLDLSDFA